MKKLLLAILALTFFVNCSEEQETLTNDSTVLENPVGIEDGVDTEVPLVADFDFVASEVSESEDLDELGVWKDEISALVKKAKEYTMSPEEYFDIEQRKKKIHNRGEDVKGSIRVFCRVRPISTWEIERGDIAVCRAVDP
ncbi:MAG: hypothetical protein HRT68_08485, partial [Flavobacteriaceae bacterium]|nr:hypothetical protein [Flavobacteriaceae bacterium]